MILPDSLSSYANQLLDALRKQCGKNIYPDIDGVQLLTLRSRLMQLNSPTQVSANQSCHLLATRDLQWLALNLSRSSDWELLPALFKQSIDINSWTQVSALVKKSDAADLVEQGRTLGLAIALAAQTNLPHPENFFTLVETGKTRSHHKMQPLVVDLSSLWAGPLCSQLLQQSGARVIKVESQQRPDGARMNTQDGAKEFFHFLNQHKELFILDFSSAADIKHLKELITEADIVIESSRPRALQQLGIDAATIIKQQAGLIWISITGYGRREPQSNWVAFGDDAAIDGGLFAIIDNKPAFIGDAIADPLTGLHAALIAHQLYQQSCSALVDINLSTVSNYSRKSLY